MKLLLLTANEFTKIFKRRGLMFFFVLVILNCFLAGLNVYESYTTAGGNFSLETELDNYRKSAITYKNQLLEYESELPSADESAVSGSSSADASETRSTDYKTYNELRFALMEAETYAAVYEKALELNILSRDDWRYSVLYDIINGEMKIACYRVILEAEPDDEDYISTVICPYLEISSNYTITEITTKLHNQTQNIETLWSGVEALDYGSYCKNQITTLQYDQAAKQSELEAINRQLEDNPSSIELAMSKRKAEGVKAAIEGKIEIQTYRYQNGIEFQSWVDRTLDIMLDKYDAYISKLNGFVTEEYFHKNGDYYEWAYADYGEYSTLLNAELQDQLDAVAIGWYSINNGVEELSVAGSTRSNMLGFSDMFTFFAFFAIVIAGVSVSSEHVTRTIYLLLIRPAKRYKVLLSKYLSCILTTLALIILSFGAYLLASVLICGAGDLSLPYLFVSDGAVVEFDFLRWMLLRVLYCSASVLFLLTMTFTASTVFRNTAFAVSSGLFTFFSPILLSTFFRNSTLYGYLPFPSFNISSFVFNDLVTLAPETISRMAGEIVVYPTFAFIWLGALTVVCLIIAFATFTKRDVTNT